MRFMKKITISKPRSRNVIEITQMDEDDWFYKIKHYNKSTGKVSESGMIVKSQIPLWTERLPKKGYSVVEEDI